MTSSLSALGQQALHELSDVFKHVKDNATDDLIEAILSARHIAVYGCGREGLAIKGFAMRLFHLGLDVHVLGDMTVPHFGKGDLLIVTSGTGHLNSGEAFINVARADGARIAVITSQPGSSTPKMADILTVIPAQTMANDQSAKAAVLPMGSMFEIAETILFELVILRLRERLGETADTMRARHTNLE
jgi:6-phospho-3-hexuloisomerase